jgi:hypothetical protein
VCWGRILATIAAFAGAAGCGRGAAENAPAGGACRADLRLFLGACVTPAVAAQACGPASIAALDGCAARAACEPGRARDLATGDCLARREVRTLASSLGILVNEDETLTCPGGGELATGNVDEGAPGPRLGCLPPPGPRAPACPTGSIPAAPTRCIPFREGGRIDVARWLHAAIGPDGGPAAAPLCTALRRSPGTLAVPGSVDVRVNVALSFPDNDVTQVVATVQGSGAGTAELEQVVAPMVEALRTLGGTANQASIATAVHCRRMSERPAVVLIDGQTGDGSGGGSQIR